jgi:hypothetical protein
MLSFKPKVLKLQSRNLSKFNTDCIYLLKQLLIRKLYNNVLYNDVTFEI